MGLANLVTDGQLSKRPMKAGIPAGTWGTGGLWEDPLTFLWQFPQWLEGRMDDFLESFLESVSG